MVSFDRELYHQLAGVRHDEHKWRVRLAPRVLKDKLVYGIPDLHVYLHIIIQWCI